jgi:hypothetical protein
VILVAFKDSFYCNNKSYCILHHCMLYHQSIAMTPNDCRSLDGSTTSVKSDPPALKLDLGKPPTSPISVALANRPSRSPSRSLSPTVSRSHSPHSITSDKSNNNTNHVNNKRNDRQKASSPLRHKADSSRSPPLSPRSPPLSPRSRSSPRPSSSTMRHASPCAIAPDVPTLSRRTRSPPISPRSFLQARRCARVLDEETNRQTKSRAASEATISQATPWAAAAEAAIDRSANDGNATLPVTADLVDTNSHIVTPNLTNTSTPANVDPSWQIPRWHALQQKRLALCQMRVQLEQQLYEQAAVEETLGQELIQAGLAVIDPDQLTRDNAQKHHALSTWLQAWDGSWEKGLPNGLGTMQLLNGQVYKGQVAHGQRHGTGRNTWPNGQVYSGSWHFNSRHGRGTHRWPDGRTVTGLWHQGHLHGGRCFFQWPDGATYDGDCWQGQKHGRGVHTWADGRIYSGTYEQGREHGFGSLTEADGVCKYRGQFQNGGRHGYGLQIWKHKTYDGQWKDNAVNGQGKLSWHTGASYTGHFKNGKYHGEGSFHDANGGRYLGSWKQGEKWGFGCQTWPSGKSYQGTFVRGKRHGYGRLNYKGGAIYIGGWRHGHRHGYGLYLTPQGAVGHIGSWKRDKPITNYPIKQTQDDASTATEHKRRPRPPNTSWDDTDALTYDTSATSPLRKSNPHKNHKKTTPFSPGSPTSSRLVDV